jgi:hypothetical protein
MQDIFHKRPSGFQTVFGFAQRCEYTDMAVYAIAVNKIKYLQFFSSQDKVVLQHITCT